MTKVTVYRWQRYEIDSDMMQQSRRWATKEAAEAQGGTVQEETATEADTSLLGAEVPGMTGWLPARGQAGDIAVPVYVGPTTQKPIPQQSFDPGVMILNDRFGS